MRLNGCGNWLKNNIDTKVLVDYKVVHNNQIYYVDRDNIEEVAYLFNVLLTDRIVKFICVIIMVMNMKFV